MLTIQRTPFQTARTNLKNLSYNEQDYKKPANKTGSPKIYPIVLLLTLVQCQQTLLFLLFTW